MLEYAKDLITNFGYAHLFETMKQKNGEVVHKSTDCITQASEAGDTSWIKDFNAKSLEESIKILYESDEVTSILINYPALLLRKKNQLYPEGRTSYRFKKELRRQVTVIGTSAFAPKKKKRLVRPNEMDLPETDEPEPSD